MSGARTAWRIGVGVALLGSGIAAVAASLSLLRAEAESREAAKRRHEWWAGLGRGAADPAGASEQQELLQRPGLGGAREPARPARLAGRVLDSTGSPVAGAEVTATGARELRTCLTDDRGTFRFDPVLLGDSCRLEVRAIGFSRWLCDAAGFVGEFDEATLPHLVLERARTISGRFLGSDGLPLSGARVAIEGERLLPGGEVLVEPLTWERHFGLDETRTDVAGRFRFEALYDGQFLVRAFGPEGALAAAVAARAGGPEVELHAGAPGQRLVVLRGRVSDARTGAPIARFSVAPMRRRSPLCSIGTPDSFEDAGGTFEIPFVPPGRVRVEVLADGFAPASIAEAELAAGDHAVEVLLWPAVDLAVRILRADGMPAEEAWIAIRDPAGEPVWMCDAAGARCDGMALAADGTATLRRLPARPLSLQVRRGDGLAGTFAVDLCARDPAAVLELRLGSDR